MTGPSLDEQAADAHAAQMRHVTDAHRVDRSGWSRQQWIDDAERLMHDLDGSVLSLVNGHVTALIYELGRVQRGMLRIMNIALDNDHLPIADSARIARIAILAQQGARGAIRNEASP